MAEGISPSDRAEALVDVKESLSRLAALSRELLERARRTTIDPAQRLSVRSLVEGSIRLATLFRRGHRCRIQLTLDRECSVVARTRDLEFILLNLLLNAVDATDGRGTVAVTATTSNGKVVIEVRDDGPGVPRDLVDRVFEPYFTTKGSMGNGVGLAVARAIAHSYDGDLTLVGPGPGAAFRVLLPSAEKS